ncbi:P-loop containing nucleoside triphosphate hydrolase protein [Thozetella sp. PMI_491]|nr:P-loop containing nucleoside triphosphate hydrolase protein [Thozetella sp. PMI_491]
MDFERYLGVKAQLEASGQTKPAIRYAFTELIEKEGKGGNPSVVIQKGSASLANEKDKRFGEYAIVTRDRINTKGESEATELEIQSETMQKALYTIISRRSQPGIFADPIIFRKPYYALFHCRKEIKEHAANESNTPEQKRHLEWLTGVMAEKLNGLEKVQETQVENGLIEFKHLGILFEAGCLVLGQPSKGKEKGEKTEKVEKTDNPECFMFHTISDELEDRERGGKYVEIEVFRWGFNGTMFGLVAETLKISEFPGLRKITELECFPWASMKEEDKNKLFPKLVTRGKKWCEYLEAKNYYYQGTAQVPKRATWSWSVRVITKNMPGRVVLDYSAFTEAFPELKAPLHNRSRQGSKDSSQPEEEVLESDEDTVPPEGYTPSDAQALLCPATSPGYNLEQKEWGFFDIDRLTDVEWASNPTEELEIDRVQKDILKDLIIEHHSRSWSTNAVPGKGEGLIFLLYGPPGCGKTLTAELLAEEEKRPLLRISCGDLGHFPSDVDRSLQALLKLASHASAIVLLDEADAFLAKRVVGSNRDYFQNAITSVFLKHLEYFPGVIFLTTNQKTEFDDAVSSRVVSLHYGPLTAKSRARIWKNHLLKGKDGAEREAIESICDDLGKDYPLDGREIKTLAYISLALCRRRNHPISKELIDHMYNMTHPAKEAGELQSLR